eukprot:gene813-1017_t
MDVSCQFNLEYRPFRWRDLNHLKQLQKSLFPVTYPDSFYKKLLTESYYSRLAWLKRYKDTDNIINENNTTPNNNNSLLIDSSENINSVQQQYNSNNIIQLSETITSVHNNIDSNNSNNNNVNSSNNKNQSHNRDYQEELVGVVTGRVNKVTGICSLCQETEGYILTLGVKDSYRSKGLGGILLNV